MHAHVYMLIAVHSLRLPCSGHHQQARSCTHHVENCHMTSEERAVVCRTTFGCTDHSRQTAQAADAAEHVGHRQRRIVAPVAARAWVLPWRPQADGQGRQAARRLSQCSVDAYICCILCCVRDTDVHLSTTTAALVAATAQSRLACRRDRVCHAATLHLCKVGSQIAAAQLSSVEMAQRVAVLQSQLKEARVRMLRCCGVQGSPCCNTEPAPTDVLSI